MKLRPVEYVPANLGIAVILVALFAAPVSGQAPVAHPAPPPVALDAGLCTAVTTSGTVSLDWNPGFDYEFAVAGIDRFSLILTNVAADGVTPIRPGGPGTFLLRSSSVTPLGNGYYHIELQVPRLQPGTYRVVDAAVAPHLIPDFQGASPKMTNSPARVRFCMTVIPSSRAQSPSPLRPGGTL